MRRAGLEFLSDPRGKFENTALPAPSILKHLILVRFQAGGRDLHCTPISACGRSSEELLTGGLTLTKS